MRTNKKWIFMRHTDNEMQRMKNKLLHSTMSQVHRSSLNLKAIFKVRNSSSSRGLCDNYASALMLVCAK